MSAIGTKRKCRVALHMSAIGGKADTTKVPALKILSGCIATVLVPLFGGWQGADLEY